MTVMKAISIIWALLSIVAMSSAMVGLKWYIKSIREIDG